MASKKEIKKESLIRLRELLSVYGTTEKVKESDKYKTTYTHFLNKYEKENINMIFDMLEKGFTDTEIRETVKESIYVKKDPVASEAENIFNNENKSDNVYSIFIKTEDMSDDEEENVYSDANNAVEDGSKDVKTETETDDTDTYEMESDDNNEDVFIVSEELKEKIKTEDKSVGEHCSETYTKKAEGLFSNLSKTIEEIGEIVKTDINGVDKETIETTPSICNVFNHAESLNNFMKDLSGKIDTILAKAV